jgi:uncharacterized protein (DUF924 family)
MLSPEWSNDVLQFWFEEAGAERWFNKDSAFDETVRSRFLALHTMLAACDEGPLVADARTALAAILVFDQMPRNMFRGTPRPFEHAEDPAEQARCVTLMATLGDPELTKWAEEHRRIIDRFGRFPHRNNVLGRPSTPEETEFLAQPGSSF